MNTENDILAELRNMGSPLADTPRTMPYSVPAGYFEQFPGTALAAIKQLNEPEMVPDWGKTMPYAVPAGYFENLNKDLVASAIAGNVSALPKEIPLNVPPRYFEQLPARMLKAAKAADNKNRLIPLKNHNIFRSVQWAAAAIFILFIGAGAYIAFFSDRSVNPEKILASVATNEIHDYLQRDYRIDVDRVVSNNEINNLQLDNKEIIQYLNETGWDVVE